MATEHTGIRAELHRAVLDERFMAEKAADQPGLPERELSSELWVVFRDGYDDVEGKDYQVAAMVGLVLAQARIDGDASVSWTLTGAPPQGRTLQEALTDLGVTLHEQWPDSWQ